MSELLKSFIVKCVVNNTSGIKWKETRLIKVHPENMARNAVV